MGEVKLKINKQKLKIFIITLCICQALIVKWSTAYFANYTIIQRSSMILGLILLFPSMKILVYKKYFKCNVIIGTTLLSVLLSTYLNQYSYTYSIWVGVTFAMQILFLSWYCEYLDSRRLAVLGTKCLYVIVFMYCIISDVLMFADPHRYFFEWGGHTDLFFVGDKFPLTYLHLLCVVLYCVLNKNDFKKKRIEISLLIFWMFLVSCYSECSTMIIGSLIFSILIFERGMIDLLLNPVFMIIYLIVCNSLLIFDYSIIQMPLIRYFIENILQKPITLSGRMNIYAKASAILNINTLFGVGIDNNYAVSMKFTNAADMQNGILDIVMSYGWVGVAIFLCFLIYALLRSKANTQPALVFAIYVYISLSIVEITFRQGLYVFLLLIILYSWKENADTHMHNLRLHVLVPHGS